MKDKFFSYWGVLTDRYGQRSTWIDSKEKELEVYPRAKTEEEITEEENEEKVNC